MRRDVGYVMDVGSAKFVKALDDAVVALMIEKAQAVENLEAILSVKGVDMVQFGPADYSMSIGLAGQFDHPKVRNAEKHVIETALKMAIAPRAEVSHPDQAKRYLDMGVKHFCMGSDVVVLFEYFRKEGREMLRVLRRDPDTEAKVATAYGGLKNPG